MVFLIFYDFRDFIQPSMVDEEIVAKSKEKGNPSHVSLVVAYTGIVRC